MRIDREYVTAQTLRDMGYVAMYSTFSHIGQYTEKLNEEQSDMLFAWTANVIQRGMLVNVQRDYWNGTVSILSGAEQLQSDADKLWMVTYFLQRNMTQAEKLEGLLTEEDF